MVRVHYEKRSGAVRKIVEGEVLYLTCDEDWEKNYLNFVAYAYSEGLSKAVLKEREGGIFLTKVEERVYRLERREELDESQIELFFAGGAWNVYEPSDVPKYSSHSLGQIFLFGGLAVGILYGAYVLFSALFLKEEKPPEKVVQPKKNVVQPLTEKEKERLRVQATYDFLKEFKNRANDVRIQKYARLSSASLSYKSLSPEVLGVVMTFSVEYLYPVEGSVLSGITREKEHVWKKSLVVRKSYRREDLKNLRNFEYASVWKCGELFLELGGLVYDRRSKGKIVIRLTRIDANDLYGVVDGLVYCPFYFRSFTLSSGKVTAEVVLLR